MRRQVLFLPPMILAGVICNEFVYWTGSSLSPLATIIVGARPPPPPFPVLTGQVSSLPSY